jgi:membrane peptidoglycan carboxypeptidase
MGREWLTDWVKKGGGWRMSRDSHDSYDGSNGRNGDGRPSPSRGSRPSDPRSSAGGPRSIGAFGPNGLIKSPLSGLESNGHSKPPSNPRSRPAGSSNGGGQSNNNHTLARMHAPRGPRRPDPDDSMELSAEAPQPRRGGRSVGQMARDLSRNISRSISRSIHQLGTSFSQVVRDAGTDERPGAPPPPLPDDLREEIEQLPYRRSRRRVVARKWRMRRIGPNPVAYAVVVMLLLVVVVLVLGGGGAGGVYAVSYYNSHQSQIRDIYNLRFTQGTKIYDRNGQLLYVAHADDTGLSIYEGLSQISQKVQLAEIETEDHTFWTNAGVDLQRTIGAAVADARSGAQSQGGSTITQQLVKNIVAKDNNKTYTRKVNEAILAYGVTINYTKGQILEMYINTLDYGDRNTGIEAAAQNYFGIHQIKNADGTTTPANEQLDWWQAALLAGVPNAPGKYLPIQYSCDKLDANGECPDSKWSNPCLNNPHEPTCNPNPNYDYTPGSGDGHEWLVYRRSLVVLDSLLRYNDITQAQHDDAVNKIHDCLVKECMGHWLVYQSNASSGSSQTLVPKLAPHFVDFVLKQLVEDFGVTDPAHTSLNVYTTLDYSLQQYAQKTVHYYVAEQHLIRWPQYAPKGCTTCLQPSLADYANGHNGAVVAIDPHTGDIMAMVGSVDYNDTSKAVAGQVNITTSPRSMGSSTKGLVYATAFQMGWNPGVMLQDQPICYPVPATITDPGQPDDGQPLEDNDAPACIGWYAPHNFEPESFSGDAPIRVMLANSLNIPATEAMCYVGCTAVTAQDIISMANRLGVDTLTAGRIGPSTALGTQEIPLLELTSAYGTFADAGKHVHYRSILKIEDAGGNTLYSAPQPQALQAISPQAAYMMDSVLTDNQARTADFNSQSPLYFPDFDVAAKTGTSQGNNGPRDILTMGYTPYLAVGVWVGNSDSTDLNPHIIGISGAGYIFSDIIQWAHDNYKWPSGPASRFPIPPGMARGQFNCITGLAPYAGVGVQPCALNMYRANSTNLYCGWGCTTRTNEDWYIQGQEWLQS